MYSEEDTTQGETSTKFSKLTYDQDKICTRCKKFEVPCIFLPEGHEKYREREINSRQYHYAYADWYRVRVIYLDYYYSRYETRLPVYRSLYSHRTLFRVSFSHLEVAIDSPRCKYAHREYISVNGKFKPILVEPSLTWDKAVPKEIQEYRTYDTEEPINRFRIVSKYLKGGFPKDRLVRTNTSTEKDRFNLNFYLQEDPRVFLSTPTYKEWTDKQDRVPTTYTETFVVQRTIRFHPFRSYRRHEYYGYYTEGIFWDQLENPNPTDFEYQFPQIPIHPHSCEFTIEEAITERKDFKRSKTWITESAFNPTLNPHCLLGIYYDLFRIWAESENSTENSTKKIKTS
jgi:hypothetical protein